MGNPKVTIAIPVYNQPLLLDRCLQSIAKQTFSDFKVIIIDDCSTANYSKVVEKYDCLKIEYRRNNINKGAMFNMKALLEHEYDSEFFTVFHEDDLMHPNLLEHQIKLFNSDASLAFVGTTMEYFVQDQYEFYALCHTNSPATVMFQDKAEFLKAVFAKKEICFGSIMYRTSYINSAKFDVDKFGALCDRPFLLNLISNNCYGGLIDAPLVYYRDHGPYDKRFGKLREEQIIDFFKAYYDVIKSSKVLKESYHRYSTNELLGFCSGSEKIGRLVVYKIFVLSLWKSYISIKYLNPKGYRVLNLYKFILSLKQFKNLF